MCSLHRLLRLVCVYCIAGVYLFCDAQIGSKHNIFKTGGNSKLGHGASFHKTPGYDCRKELDGQIFQQSTRGKQCSDIDGLMEECTKLFEFLDPTQTATSKDYTQKDEPIDITIKEIDFLPYALYPERMDNFIKTKRKLSKAYRMSTDLVGPDSVQFYLGTKDKGRTLLIFFPGTSNLEDVKVDINVKHTEVSLPGLVPERFRYERPDKYRKDSSNEGLEKRSDFDFDRFYARTKIHDGIHRRLYDPEIQRALQEDLLYLYSGIPVMAGVAWNKWIRDNNISDPLRDKLKRFGFDMQFDASGGKEKTTYYTNPRAMHLASEQFRDFTKDASTTRKDIDHVVNAIDSITKKKIKRLRKGIDIQKVEKLIISGHSLGAAYATYFFLRLYGDGFSRNAPGYDVFPDDPRNVVVIPFAAPSIVFWEHTRHIKDEIVSRIFNIWNNEDPVPMILNGMKYINRENLGLTFATVMAHLSDDSLENLGTNQPIGNLMVFMRGKQRIKLTSSEMEEKKKSVWKRMFTSGGKTWKADSEEQVWFKVFSYKRIRVHHSADTPEDQRSLYYAKYGAQCLWKTTNFGVLGAIPRALKQHLMKKYRENIRDSCLNDYLQQNSEYWQELFPAPSPTTTKVGIGARMKKWFGKSAKLSEYNTYGSGLYDQYGNNINEQQMLYFVYEPREYDESYAWMFCLIVAIALIGLIVMAYTFIVGVLCGYASKVKERN